MLDDVLIENKKPETYLDIIKYWEEKRILYNLCVGTIGLLIYVPVVQRYGILLFDLVLILIIGLVSNVFFSFGCYLLLFLKSKNVKMPVNYFYLSRVLLITGTLLSIISLFLVAVLSGLAMILD